VTPVPGFESIAVSWTKPTTGTVTSYTVKAKTGPGAGAIKCTSSAPTTNCVVNGLAPGQAYSIKVEAFNGSLAGPFSAKVTATASGVPNPPTDATISAVTSTAVKVSWLAPATNNTTINNYTVTANPGGATCSPTLSNVHNCTVTGLSTGTSYTFTVVADSPYGNSVPSAPSEAAEPGSPPPNPPTGVVADGELNNGGTAALVSFYAPTNTGGSPIVGYYVTVNDKTAHTTNIYPAPASDATSNGNTNGYLATGLSATDQYTFAVSTVNGAGAGSPSAAVYGLPAAPTGLSATGNPGGTASLSFTPSTVTLGNPVTGLGVTSVDLTQLAVGPSTTVSGTATSANLSGLNMGDLYDVCVTAQQSLVPGGGGQETCTEFTEPEAPGTPTAVTAAGELVSGSPSVVVSFTAPANTGTATISGYTVVVDDTTADTVTDVSAPAGAATVGSTPGTGVTVTGLNGGDTYTFAVYASSTAGNGTASAAVGPTPPAPATLQYVDNGDGSVTLTWTPPTVTFGTTITGFNLDSADLGPTSFGLGPSGTAGPTDTTSTLSGFNIGDTYDICMQTQNSSGTGQNEVCTGFFTA
jgi:titin